MAERFWSDRLHLQRLALISSACFERCAFLLLLVLVLLFTSCSGGKRGTWFSPSSRQPISIHYESSTSASPGTTGQQRPIDILSLSDKDATIALAEPRISLFLLDVKNSFIKRGVSPVTVDVFSQEDGAQVIRIMTLSASLSAPPLLGYLRFDDEVLAPKEITWNESVYEDFNSIRFHSLRMKSYVALAGLALGSAGQRKVPAGTVLVEISFTDQPMRVEKMALSAPTGDANRVTPTLTRSGANLRLSFEGRNIGDYNLDGTVDVADIATLAEHFQKSKDESDWMPRDDVVDGDSSGTIDIADIVPIAEHFFSVLSGYDVELAFMPEGDEGEPNFQRLENPSDPGKPTIEYSVPPADSGWPSYTLTIIPQGYGTYYAKVIPIGRTLEERGIESQVASYTFVNLPPMPPANFHSTGFTKNSVSLAWNLAFEGDVVGYHVFYSDDPQADELAEFTRANPELIPFATTEYTVTGLTSNRTYYFYISSQDSEGQLSNLSDILATRISVDVLDLPPAPPSNFAVTATDYTSVTFTWSASSEADVVGYNIYYTDIESAQFSDFTLAPLMPLSPDVTEFTVSGLTEFTTYYFVISSIDEASQESPEEAIMSTLVSAVTVVYPVAMAKILEKEQYGTIYEDYPLTFSAEDSYSPAGATLTEFTWDFGDGTPPETVPAPGTATHIYPVPYLDYTVKLTVRDEYGAESSTTIRTGTIQKLTEQRILLVWNTNSPNVDGVIKDYYGSPYTGRGIPAEFVLGLPMETTEEIGRQQYNEQIRDPIRQYLTNTIIDGTPMKNIIHYIVTTKDVPLKIRGSGGYEGEFASVDSELTLVFENYQLAPYTPNPYYGWYSSDPTDKGNPSKSQPFVPFRFTRNGITLNYLVTRLTGFTVDDVKAMIDRSLNPYSGNIYWVILDDANKNYDMMNDPTADGTESATSVLNRTIGPNHFYSDSTHQGDKITKAFLDPINPQISLNVIGYVSHGVHSGFGEEYIIKDLGFTYLPGALFMSYESFNGISFRNGPGPNHDHGQVADFIHMGGTGGIGNVYEPYSDAVGDESIIFAEYLYCGRNLAEALYKGLRRTSWVEVVVGDPLTTVRVQ